MINKFKDFFKSEDGGDLEAVKFLNYYDSKDWMVGKKPMQNWHDSAINWISNMNKFGKKVPHKTLNYLHVEEIKDYSIPL